MRSAGRVILCSYKHTLLVVITVCLIVFGALLKERQFLTQLKSAAGGIVRLELRRTDAAGSSVSSSKGAQLHDLPSPFYLHYIRFRPQNGNGSLRFTDYLSVLSAVKSLKPDAILVHGEFEPQGQYWDKLKAKQLVRHVKRTKSVNVGQRLGVTKVVGFVEHAADIAKLDILLEYGGVVADFDVFFIRGERIKDMLRRKKIVTCFGDVDGYNIGMVAAHRDSKLLYAWRRSYRDIYVADWNFNQAFVSKYLSVLYRDEVYVVDKVCNNPSTQDLPSFFKDFGKVNWKNSVAIHSYERFGHVTVDSPRDLEGNLTSHKEMLRFVYGQDHLPPVDVAFKDEIDPLTSELKVVP